jgi:hypothetical protein
VDSSEGIIAAVGEILSEGGCWLLEIKVKQGSRPDLGRPKRTPQQNKQSVMEYLSEGI